MKKIYFGALLVFCFSMLASAQPRPAETSGQNSTKAKPAPESVEAKYEGGMFGFNDKVTGTLKFDDANRRLVFLSKDQKELFQIPYDAFLLIYPQSQSVTSTAGNVVKYIPLPGAALAGLIKEKRRYLVARFDDPDVDAKGLVNFKLDNKDLLDSVLQTLAEKAKLTQRGDAYFRPKPI